jgi:hypothetical protein
MDLIHVEHQENTLIPLAIMKMAIINIVVESCLKLTSRRLQLRPRGKKNCFVAKRSLYRRVRAWQYHVCLHLNRTRCYGVAESIKFYLVSFCMTMISMINNEHDHLICDLTTCYHVYLNMRNGHVFDYPKFQSCCVLWEFSESSYSSALKNVSMAYASFQDNIPQGLPRRSVCAIW